MAKKVHFTKTVEDLETYIPRSRIIKELGGDEDWSYQYAEPVTGENARMNDTTTRNQLQTVRDDIVKRYELATLRWLDETRTGHANGNGNLSRPGTSASAGTSTSAVGEVVKERAKLAADLKANSWRIDPYVRARTHYDRVGVLKEGGVLDFYPSKKSVASSTGHPNDTRPDDVD